ELPGVPKDNVCVDVRGDKLIIKGEDKVHEAYNTGTRSIPFPIKVDTEKAMTKFENGILEIRLPSVESTTTK
ncbi:737_t:CDS:2, partial [Dentiscutata erythropus]